MLANYQSGSNRFVSPSAAVLSGSSRMLTFTRADLAALSRMGLVPEDASTELLDGVIVHTDRAATGEDVLRVGREHRICVERLSNLRTQINSDSRHVQSQQPLACGDNREPQPDFMVIKGRLEDVGEDGPWAADAFCVVEVADSSYERDAGVKLATYARAGVPQYVIVNLRNRTAEVYAGPDAAAGTYSPPTIVGADGVLTLRVGGDGEPFAVPLADVLP
jgi:hypothetical protein